MKNYSIYRFFKGEKENPFEAILKAHEIDNSHLPPSEQYIEYDLPFDELQKLGIAHMFWFYEEKFEEEFIKNKSSDWFAFFYNYGLGNDFMKILSEEDYKRPTEKKKAAILDLWLNDYLFVHKLYGEYGGENEHKKDYYSTSCPITSLCSA